MSYQVLARKWRPRTFKELVGQAHVVKALVNALDNDRLHHAFLFTGTRGVGKTTLARILAKSLNCEQGVTSEPCGVCSACSEINEGRFVDLIEVDAASRTKVDETRELLDNVQYAPTRGRYKVYLIDEVHMFSNHSFNALLKTLEEPPPHVKFLLATTDPQKLPVTILSRCLQFNLKRLPQEEIRDYLQQVLGKEDIAFEQAALALIARAADGSMRDALSLLDQAIAYGSGALSEADVRSMLGSIEQTHIIDLLTLLAASDGPGLLARVALLAEHTPDFGGVLAELISTLHRVALAQTAPQAIDDSLGDREAILALAGEIPAEDVQLYYQIALLGRRDLPLAPEPRGGFEMVLLRMLAFRPAEAGQAPAAPPAASANATAAGATGLAASGAGSAAVTSNAANATNISAARAALSAALDEKPAEKKTEHIPPAPPPLAETPGEQAPTPPSSIQSGAPETQDTAPPSPPAPGAQDWESLVRSLKLSGMNLQLALNCALHKRAGDTFQLRMAPAHQQLLGKSREETLAQALGEQLGQTVKLDISISETVGDTPASLQQARDEQRLNNARSAIESDDAVQAFKEVFGAQVQTDSVQPRENRTEDLGLGTEF